MITVRLETPKVKKTLRHLFPFPKLILENDFRFIHEFQVESLIDADIENLREAIDFILRHEPITLAARQNIIDKIIAIVEFYKEDQRGPFA